MRRVSSGSSERDASRSERRARVLEVLTRIRRIAEGVSRPWKIAAGSVLGLVVVSALAFGPIVRHRIAREGERRNLEVRVGSVRPGFFAVSLGDVDVRLQGVDGVVVTLDEVRVELSTFLGLREVLASHGKILVEGEPEELAERIKAFRARGGSAASEGKGRRTPISAEGLELSWRLPSGGSVSASALSLARDDDGVHLRVESLSGAHQRLSARFRSLELDLTRDNALQRMRADTLSLAQASPPRTAPQAAAAPPSSASALLPPPPPPVITTTTKGGKAQVQATALAAPELGEPLLPLPDLHALRGRFDAASKTVLMRVPDGSKVEIGGLDVKLDVGGEPFAFGPGPFALERRGNVVALSFKSEGTPAAQADGTTPLSFDAELPLEGGDVVAKLEGGPVSLAMLGVPEGAKGLFDVGQGRVSGKGRIVLGAAGDAVTFDGQLGLRGVSIKQARLSPEPIRGLAFSVGGRGMLDDRGRLRVDDATLDVGALHVRAHGNLEDTRDHFALALGIDMDTASCQSLLDSVPGGLLPTVRSTKMSGTIGGTANVAFDTRAIDKLTLEYQVDDRCKMVEVPKELSRETFASSFVYRTYHPDGTAFETTSGPDTASWTALEDISPFMPAAVLTTEDGAFYKHHGFNHAAIRGSVAANLKARRFVRGASTITMQLAKNLFLSRDKALSRKIEEVILTDYLEQSFRKDDMMELYLNVVEFGPDVYGITQAADYYFGRKPDELTLPECFFLASLLPSPVRYGKLAEKGTVPDSWMRHLRTLMTISAKYGKISKADLEQALVQEVVFIKPGDPRPEPRKPIRAGLRDPYEDDAAWQPLD